MVFILGNDIPLTILLPFFLIMIMLIFFLATYLKDNLGKLKIFRVKKKSKKEIKAPVNFGREYLILKRKISSLTTAESLDEIALIIKKYIAEKLNINQQFSFEELPRDKLDWSIIEFTNRLSDLKYSGKEITRDEVNHLLLYLSKIIKIKIQGKAGEESFPTLKLPALPRIIFPKFPKINIRFPKRKHEIISHKEIIHKEPKPIRLGSLPKKITINLANLFRKYPRKLEEHEVLDRQKEIISLINRIRHNIGDTGKALDYCNKAIEINKTLPKHGYLSKLKSLKDEIIKTRDRSARTKELEAKKQITLKEEKKLARIRGKIVKRISLAQRNISNYNKSLWLYKRSKELSKSLT